MKPTPHPQSGIKSFVRRAGRLTSAQSRALENLWPIYGINISTKPITMHTIFKRHAPLIVDIGVGTGASTIHHALAHPENNYLAIEVHRPGIGHLLNEIEKNRLSNIRVVNEDVMNVLSTKLDSRCISQCFIFFPDPWPKKRHHKRRLLNSELLNLLKQRLCLHGRLHIATDSASYTEHIDTLFSENKDYINLAGSADYAPRPTWRITTRYENRGLGLNHAIKEYCFSLR